MTLVVAGVAVLMGGVVRGYAGFGASMFWVASLSLIYAPASVVPTVLALEVAASLGLLPRAMKHVEWRSMSWMLVATVATMPAGVALLALMPERGMRLIVALAIASGTLAMASGVDLTLRSGRRTALTAGAISGVINGSTGVGGPPAVLLYFSPGRSVTAGRATLIAYFLATDAAGLLFTGLAGLVDRPVLVHAAVFTPLALVGITTGQYLFQHHGDRGFRTVVVVVLLALSGVMLVQALLG